MLAPAQCAGYRMSKVSQRIEEGPQSQFPLPNLKMSSLPLMGLALSYLFQTGVKQAEKLPGKGELTVYCRPAAQKSPNKITVLIRNLKSV